MECCWFVKIGMLCSVYMLGNEEEIIFVVIDLLVDIKLVLELFNEVYYYCVKVYLDVGKMDGVMEDLKVLVKDICNVYGVEVKYKVVQIYFDGG